MSLYAKTKHVNYTQQKVLKFLSFTNVRLNKKGRTGDCNLLIVHVNRRITDLRRRIYFSKYTRLWYKENKWWLTLFDPLV